ncbi:LmrA/YxaF family transcription factor [Dietzia sp.]|uniref:LmrA/YxaF family transcription factor n=1 Tax=Dietzia sp. TaxID=1871616 RepID=UPI002FD8F8E3
MSAAFDEVGGQVEAALIDMEEQGRTGAELLGAMCEFYAESLRESGFVSGCPIGSALTEIHDDTDFAPRLRTILESWLRVLARTLRRDGVSADDADELSMLAISSLEGAILTARITRDTAPVEAVRRRICPLLIP